MESNKDEALRALAIARTKLEEGDGKGAKKFAQKSQSLYASQEAAEVIRKADQAVPKASGFEKENGASSTAHRTPKSSADGGSSPSSTESKSFTTVQVKIVERVRKCRHTSYYEILELQKEATDAQIKKSYRKLALQLHPDKNGAPGADEAFKMVSRAFQILSDEQKRSAYDRYGDDSDVRAASSSSSPFARHAFNSYDDEMSPNDLFNMFFNGMGGGFGGGGPFGGVSAGGFTTFPGGIRVQTFGGGPSPGVRRRAGRQAPQQQQQQQQQPQSTSFGQLLPLLILFLIVALPNLLGSSSTTSTDTQPKFSFTPTPQFTVQRETPNHHIPFYITPDTHTKFSRHKLSRIDHHAEVSFVNRLNDQCHTEVATQRQAMQAAQGWFGIKDKDAWNKARLLDRPSCRQLEAWGYNVQRENYQYY